MGIFRLVVEAAKKVSWWKVLAAGAATVAGVQLVDMILSDKDLTFMEKLERLNKAQLEGKVTKEEWQKGRDSLMTAYSSQR
jgi:hypothetical protein